MPPISFPRKGLAVPLVLMAAACLAFAAGAGTAAGPFAAAFFIAYLLRPAAVALESTGMNRGAAAAVTLSVFFGALGAGLAFGAPLLFGQAVKLALALSQYFDKIRKLVLPRMTETLSAWDPSYAEKAQSGLAEAAAGLPSALRTVVERAWDSASALTGAASFLLIAPLIAFYILLDWDKLAAGFLRLAPIRWQGEIKECAAEIDKVMAGYLRGQGLICMTLGAIYAGGLTLAELNYGFAIGLITGALAFVPYLGMVAGAGTAMTVSWMQYHDLTHLAVTAGVFAAGQALDASFLTPRVMGERVGLHPAWMIFALMAGGGMFGFMGVLLAVPAAACLGALVRRMIRSYHASEFYRH